MADLRDLQRRAGEWHRARFPGALQEHVALALCAEAGEVADAVVGAAGFYAVARGDVLKESADVCVALFALLDRWYPEADLLGAIAAKLDRLTNPRSGHRAALTEGIPQ
jgi:hypothetical protein